MEWKLRTKSISFQTPKIMAILNITPDSFFDGGQFNDPSKAVDRAYQVVDEGAHILDIGGESTRPGSQEVSEKDELSRVMPVIQRLLDEGYPLPISIDTKKAKVAQEALEAGVEILNDVSGFQNPAMREVAWKYQPGVCIMHMKGIPANMQKNPYYDDVFQEISQFLLHQARLLEEKNDKGRGLAKEKIVLDPGIGFGKRLEDNLDIFLRIPDFVQLGYPVLIGASRKSFIQMICGEKTPRLGGSVAIHFYSFMKGASIVRVHDVKETREALLLWEALYKREKEIQGLSVF